MAPWSSLPSALAGSRLGEHLLAEHPALLEHQLHVDAGRDLEPGVVLPRGDRVGPGVDLEGPPPFDVRGDPRVVAVGDRLVLRHAHGWPPAAVGRGQHDLGRQPVVSLAEHRRAHREGLADGRLRRLPTEVDHGHDVHDGDASDHFSNLARSRGGGARPPLRARGTQRRGWLEHVGNREPGEIRDGWARPHVAPTRVPPQRGVPGCVMPGLTRVDWSRSPDGVGAAGSRIRPWGWNDPSARANVCGCEPSDDSPSAPCSPRRCPRSATWPTT